MNAPPRVLNKVRGIIRVEAVFASPPRPADYLQAMRLHQWLKNLLVLVPLALAHRFDQSALLFQALLAFLAFGLCASGVYLLNDLLDLPANRAHPTKGSRAYSLRLKRIVLLDVFILAALYTLRMIAGAAATGIPLSFWLLAFSMFFFLSLALVKRYAELLLLEQEQQDGAAGRGYRLVDLETLSQLSITSDYLAVLVLSLYIDGDTVGTVYRYPEVI